MAVIQVSISIIAAICWRARQIFRTLEEGKKILFYLSYYSFQTPDLKTLLLRFNLCFEIFE